MVEKYEVIIKTPFGATNTTDENPDNWYMYSDDNYSFEIEYDIDPRYECITFNHFESNCLDRNKTNYKFNITKGSFQK